MSLRLYLSGPMQGMPGHNLPAFERARTRLRRAGYLVTCPAELGHVEDWEWADYLRRDIRELLDCHAVAVLPGWQDSKGARLETHVADELGMRAEPVEFWLASSLVGERP